LRFHGAEFSRYLAKSNLAEAPRKPGGKRSDDGRMPMDEDKLNMEIRKFLKEVGVTSQREIERVLREGTAKSSTLHLKMVLTSKDVPSLEHVVEHKIKLA
jgi:hypothetical protein